MSQAFNPYQSPQEVAPAPQANIRGLIPFQSGGTRGMFAVGLLGLGILGNVLALLSNVSQYNLLDGVKQGNRITRDVAEANDDRQRTIGLFDTGVYLCTAVAFLMWVHRAYRNLPALGAAVLESTPGKVVGSYFVPFANLVWPYQAMVEIAKGSDPLQGNISSNTWQRPRSSPLVPLWWAFYILMNVLGWMAFSAAKDMHSLDSALSATISFMISDGSHIVSACLAIALILMINSRQEDRNRANLENPEPNPPGTASGERLAGFLDNLG